MKGVEEQILCKYSYKKESPTFSSNNYSAYNGKNKETNQPVTIRILKYPHVELGGYLHKLKELKSDNVIRIYELVVEQSLLICVSEQVCFGNMMKAL